MKIFHYIGMIVGPQGFFGPGFFADFKEGWINSVNSRSAGQVRKTPIAKASCDLSPDGYIPVWDNLHPDDIWDLPDTGSSPKANGSKINLVSLDKTNKYSDMEDYQPDTSCILAKSFMQGSYR